MPQRPVYPPAPRTDAHDVLHGVVVPDPYRWLESGHEGDAAGREAWATAQAALVADERASWTTEDRFAQRVGELLQGGSVSPPFVRGERTFFMRRTGDQQLPVLWTIDPDGTERVLIDPLALDPDGLTTLDSWQPSKEGDRLAYLLSERGTEEPVLSVMDVATGELLDGPIDRVRFSPVAWVPGGEAFYYVRRIDPSLVPEEERAFHRRVYLHRLGQDTAQDVEVFGEGRPITSYYGVLVSRDGRWLEISSSEGTEPRNDLWFADLAAGSLEAPELVPVQVGVDAQSGLHFGRDGRFYVHTDLDAPRARLAIADPARPQPGHWVDLVPEDPEAVLNDFAILDGPDLDAPQLLVSWTRHMIGELTLHDLATGELLRRVDAPGIGTVGGLVEQPAGGPRTWFVYTDHTTQPHVHVYDARTGSVSLHAAPPGLVEVPKVHTRLEEYTSADGTTVRMYLMSPTADPDRPRPALLTGYGGFGIPMSPAFSATALAWVEAGGVYAVACLRGGGEEGEEWHRAGMLADKQNVFDDFHAAAEHLVAQGWTTASQLGITGGSNGGLLVGAALTQRPDLYAAVVCVAPLLDMVRYTTSELGLSWTVEYGDPQVEEELGWLLSYSPYHHVAEGTEYPATLFMVFDNDTRTDPMHARKLCAALQHAQAGDGPILLRSEGDVGHGARAVSRSVAESATMLAFVARWTGLQEHAG